MIGIQGEVTYESEDHPGTELHLDYKMGVSGNVQVDVHVVGERPDLKAAAIVQGKNAVFTVENIRPPSSRMIRDSQGQIISVEPPVGPPAVAPQQPVQFVGKEFPVTLVQKVNLSPMDVMVQGALVGKIDGVATTTVSSSVHLAQTTSSAATTEVVSTSATEPPSTVITRPISTTVSLPVTTRAKIVPLTGEAVSTVLESQDGRLVMSSFLPGRLIVQPVTTTVDTAATTSATATLTSSTVSSNEQASLTSVVTTQMQASLRTTITGVPFLEKILIPAPSSAPPPQPDSAAGIGER